MLAALCGLALLVPAAAANAATGSTTNKGRVVVGAKITRFAVVDRNIIARGVLTSRVAGGGQTQLARTPVRFAVAAQAGRCNVLTLTLNDLQLSLLGLNVDLSEVNLRIFAIRRGDGSGILGRLFCALSRSTLRLGRGASAAHAQKVVRSLNLLGLVVQLYGPSRNQPVTLTITATRGGGVLGDLFCSLGAPA
jgi:hypothetical protein